MSTNPTDHPNEGGSMSTIRDIPATNAPTTGRFSVTACYDGYAPCDILTGLWKIIRGGGLHVDGNRITARGATEDDEDPRAIAAAVAGAMTADNVAHMSVLWEQGSMAMDENGDIPF